MANVKISGLPAATSITAGTDVAPLVSGGITTKATPQQIVNAGLLAPGAIGSGTPSTGKFTTIESTIATGTAPFTVASTTNVANLNASSLGGATFASPGAIGSGTASTGAFTTLSASSTVSGTGFSTYLASPPAIGTTAPAAGKFTDLTSTGNTTIGDASTDTFTVYPQTISLINSTAITAASTKTLTLNGGAGSNGLVIDASNNVCLGRTTPFSSSIRCSIQQDAAAAAAYIYSTASSNQGNPALVLSKFDNTSTTSQIFAQFFINANSTPNGQINANGASAAAFGSFSDSRLKENIVALPDQLANICALKPSEFDYKDGSGHQIGFIAQEMQEVYPDVVGEGDDGMLTITGWSKTEARLVKAIQELSQEIETLKQRIK